MGHPLVIITVIITVIIIRIIIIELISGKSNQTETHALNSEAPDLGPFSLLSLLSLLD